MMNTIAFLSIRVLHVLFAAIWLGGVAFLTLFLMPTIKQAGPAGGQVMAVLMRGRFQPFISSISGLTMLSGIYLYWRFTGGFDPAVSRTTAGMAFGVGGMAGILAGVIGGAVVGRGSQRMMELAGKASALPDGPERQSAFATIEALRNRVAAASKIVLLFMVIAASLMALGHYV